MSTTEVSRYRRLIDAFAIANNSHGWPSAVHSRIGTGVRTQFRLLNGCRV